MAFRRIARWYSAYSLSHLDTTHIHSVLIRGTQSVPLSLETTSRKRLIILISSRWDAAAEEGSDIGAAIHIARDLDSQ